MTSQALASISLQPTGTPPFDDVLISTTRASAVRSGRFKQSVRLSVDLPKKLMGKVMGALMRAHKGEFDGKVANKWVGEMLS